jgi:hypothetical protein
MLTSASRSGAAPTPGCGGIHRPPASLSRRAVGTFLAGATALSMAGLPMAGPVRAADPGPPAATESSAPEPARDDGTEAPRPADLVILQEKIGRQGLETFGVFGAQADPDQPGIWRVRLWEQTIDRARVSVDIVSCAPTAPMRLTGDERHLYRRLLNPGGEITRANRLDHLVWWAVCQPSLAGRDPATLAPMALKLGYSGNLPEREEILPAPRR